MSEIRFLQVEGYLTIERARARGQEVEELLKKRQGPEAQARGWSPRWMVVGARPGRWVPAFFIGDVAGGPGPLIGMRNVCSFN